MAFNPQQHNQRFLQHLQNNQTALNEAHAYGVVIVGNDDVQAGETYWRVIGVYHLTPEENRSNHHIYLEALNQDGERMQTPPAWVGWTWEGRQNHETAAPVPLDKPANEAGANIALGRNQVASVWILGRSANASDKSDKVINLSTNHSDEPAADGQLFNTIGHHSFYVVFQESIKDQPDTTSNSSSVSAMVEPETGSGSAPVSESSGSVPTTNNALIEHYVLFSAPGTPNLAANVAACAPFLTHFTLAAGFDPELARRARRVSVIGDGVLPRTIKAIRAAGAVVEQLPNNPTRLQQILESRIRNGVPFAG